MPSPQKLPKEDFYDGLMEAMRDGIASGVGNFFSNIWVGAGRFQEDFLGVDDYDGRRVAQNTDDNIRFIRAIKSIIENEKVLYQTVKVIIEDTMSQLSYQQQEQISASSLKSSTRFMVSLIVAGSITAKIVEKISYVLGKQLLMTGFWKTITGWVTKGAFLIFPIEALLARASNESRMLKYQNPKLYNKLYPTGGDMLYFIFKPVVQHIKEY